MSKNDAMSKNYVPTCSASVWPLFLISISIFLLYNCLPVSVFRPQWSTEHGQRRPFIIYVTKHYSNRSTSLQSIIFSQKNFCSFVARGNYTKLSCLMKHPYKHPEVSRFTQYYELRVKKCLLTHSTSIYYYL